MDLSQIDDHLFNLIQSAADSDPYELSLKLKHYSPELRKFIAAQVKAGQKTRRKIPLFYEKGGLVYPPAISVEQASSQKTASYKSKLVNCREIIDLTGGMGIDSIFFAENAEKVYYIEKNPELAAIAKHNFNILKTENILVINNDANEFIKDFSGKAGLIYLDPSRRKKTERFFRLEDSEPDIDSLLPKLYKKSDEVMIKLSPFLDITYLVNKFDFLFEVHILAVDQECKELLIRLSSGKKKNQPEIITCDIHENSEQLYSFSYDQIRNKCDISNPAKYLFDPNVAIRKSAIFYPICKEFGLKKISANSHLFTGDRLPENFPGKAFEIERIASVREFYREKPVKKGIIITRNFPEAVELIRKKAGIAEGEDTYVFGTRRSDHKPVFLVCKRIY